MLELDGGIPSPASHSKCPLVLFSVIFTCSSCVCFAEKRTFLCLHHLFSDILFSTAYERRQEGLDA
jgi:hypothetical protein